MFFLCKINNNRFMKKLVIVLVFIVIGLIVCGFVFSGGSKNQLENADYLRIHIRANSNSEVDQKVKYKIKDAYIDFLTPKIAECKTKTDVENVIVSEKKNLEYLADEILQNNGFDYKSNVKINAEMFPTRSYDGYTLESGVYDAVIVELGSAEGNNWWCVIYPPLCFTNYSSTNSNSVVYKSKILEIIKQFFS